MSSSAQLHALESANLIQVAALEPELEYLFRHSLVQEVAYFSLVRADRRALHLYVGEAIERLFQQSAASREIAPTLARHFLEAGDEARALAYFWTAGQAAEAVYATAEAASHFSSAVDIVRRLPPKAQSGLAAQPGGLSLQSVYVQCGEALQRVGRYDEAIGLYRELERLAQTRQDERLELAAVIAQAAVRSVPSPAFDPAQGQALSHRALELAGRLGDRAAEARILWYLMLAGFFGSVRAGIREHGERALALARELNLEELQAYILSDLAAYVYSLDGEHERGQAATEEARTLWRKLGNLRMLAGNLSATAFTEFRRGQLGEALAHLNEAEPIVQQTGDLWGRALCQGVMGLIFAEQGQVDRALTAFEAAIGFGETSFAGGLVIVMASQAGLYYWLGEIAGGLDSIELALGRSQVLVSFWITQVMGGLGLLRLAQGETEAAVEAIARGLEGLKEGREYAYSSLLLIADCELRLAQGRPQEAASRAVELIEILRRQGESAFVPHLLWMQGRALLALGQSHASEARAAFQSAADLARAQGSVHALWRALAGLSHLAEAGEARALRGEARRVVEFIAANIASAELRATFLNQPDVLALIQDQSLSI